MFRFHAVVAAALALCSCCALAQDQVLVLSVSGMTCPTCPITLKKALLAQHGVKAVVVHYEDKQLDVTFDDAIVGRQAIVQTTAKVGFPANVVSERRP